MQRSDILARWVGIETGNGLDKARRIVRYLSIAAPVAFISPFVISRFLDLPWWIYLNAGTLAGWLMAERNALDWRVKSWPIVREYIDWGKVHADFSRTE